MKKLIALAFVAGVLALAPAQTAQAVTLHPSLTPGDTFHLVFITADRRDALSPNIADYNTFVQNQAASAGLDTLFGQSLNWRVIGSTDSVHARDNIGDPTSPIYNTMGQTVAANETDLWDAALENPIEYDQHANLLQVFVGTGTTSTGEAAFPIGSPIFFTVGFSGNSEQRWINTSEDRTQAPYSFYAISSEITYVPEPTTLALMGLAGLMLTRRAAPPLTLPRSCLARRMQ